jgi:hypothetical protein
VNRTVPFTDLLSFRRQVFPVIRALFFQDFFRKELNGCSRSLFEYAQSTVSIFKIPSMNAVSKKPAPESVWTWILITLLWGSVFFATSTWMLAQASAWLDTGGFRPDRSVSLTVYLLYAPVLVVIALVAMLVKNRLDPGSRRQIERQKAVRDGRRERYFVSFAGSIATSFLFTVLTAAAHMVTAPVTGAVVRLDVMTVVLAGLLNITAGLAASLFVGMIFIVSGIARGSKRK